MRSESKWMRSWGRSLTCSRWSSSSSSSPPSISSCSSSSPQSHHHHDLNLLTMILLKGDSQRKESVWLDFFLFPQENISIVLNQKWFFQKTNKFKCKITHNCFLEQGNCFPKSPNNHPPHQLDLSNPCHPHPHSDLTVNFFSLSDGRIWHITWEWTLHQFSSSQPLTSLLVSFIIRFYIGICLTLFVKSDRCVKQMDTVYFEVLGKPSNEEKNRLKFLSGIWKWQKSCVVGVILISLPHI